MGQKQSSHGVMRSLAEAEQVDSRNRAPAGALNDGAMNLGRLGTCAYTYDVVFGGTHCFFGSSFAQRRSCSAALCPSEAVAGAGRTPDSHHTAPPPSKVHVCVCPKRLCPPSPRGPVFSCVVYVCVRSIGPPWFILWVSYGGTCAQVVCDLHGDRRMSVLVRCGARSDSASMVATRWELQRGVWQCPRASWRGADKKDLSKEHVAMMPTQLQEWLESWLHACVSANVPTVKGTATTITEGLIEQVCALVDRVPQAIARSTGLRRVSA